MPEELDEDHPMRPTVLNRAPEYRVADAAWGTTYGAYRHNDDGRMSWRVANFLFPFWSQTPNVRFASRAIARAWVPMDDEHVMLFNITGGSDEGIPPTPPQQRTVALYSERRSSICRVAPIGSAAGARRRMPPTTGEWTGRRNVTTSIIPAFRISRCRINRLPRAWVRSPTTSSSTCAPQI